MLFRSPEYQAPVKNALGPGAGAPPVAPVMPTFDQVPPSDSYPSGGGPQIFDPAAIQKYNQDLADYYKKLAEYNATPQGSNVLMGRPVREGNAGGAPAQDWRSLMDPGYEFRKQEGINALAAAGAASGNYGSGNMGVALQDFGQNLASQEFQNVYNRLAGMSGTGQVQSQAIGGLGVNTGNAMANYLNQAGQNIAQGGVAASNALIGGARNLENGIASYYMYQPAASAVTAADQGFFADWAPAMWGA